MFSYKPTARRFLVVSYRYAFALTLLLAAASGAVKAQSPTDGTTPSGMAPGAPAGSYALSDFDGINFFNGHLNFSLPLLKVGGRGGAQIPVVLPIVQPWRAERHGENLYQATPNWWAGETSADLSGFLPGSLEARLTGEGLDYWPCPGYVDPVAFYWASLTRFTFTAPDGTEYELRDRQTGGKPATKLECRDTGFSRGRVFVTADGSAATFIADDEVRDDLRPGEGGQAIPSGYLLLKDGTRYRIVNGFIRRMSDRNGNALTFEYYDDGVSGVTYNPVILRGASLIYKIKDSLNREVTFLYDQTDAQHGLHDQINFEGFGGAARTIRISHARLHDLLRQGFTTRTHADLFPGVNNSTHTLYDPYKVSAVWLPDGRGYSFLYNSHGELAQVTLPTGGYFQYDHDVGVDPYDDLGNYDAAPLEGYAGTYRRVVAKRVYTGAGGLLSGMTFSRPEHSGQSGNRGYVDVDTFDAGGVRLSRVRHFYRGSAVGSILRGASAPATYAGWEEGREYKTEIFDGGLALLRRVEHTWQQKAPVAWWVFQNCGACAAELEPANDPRITETLTTLAETNQVAKQTFAYDQYNNLTDTYEYDYGAGDAPAHPVRHTHTDYLTTNAVGGVSYDYACDPSSTCSNENITPNVIHQRGLPRARRVYSVHPSTGAETLAAKGETRYDETAYPLFTYEGVAVPGWADPATPARGNATSVRNFIDAAASAPDDEPCPPGVCVETHARYDQLGNLRSSWDAKGNLSQVSYLDSFCNGPACGGTYTPHAFAFPTVTRSPKPDPSGAYGLAAELTTSTVYDFYTGLVYSAKDANNQTTRYEYADPLDRPTAEVRPDADRPDGVRTDIYYSQPHETSLYVRTLTDFDGARRLKFEQHFDGLGRPHRSFTWENQDVDHPWRTADTHYDALGRAWRVSNPYRSAGPGSPAEVNRAGVETTFDALGRVTRVKTTADGAAVKTDYSGNRVLVTDQADRQRISKTDALGRLVEVWEVTPDDPAEYPGVESIPSAVTAGLPASAHGYRTDYLYDAAGNLRRVKQGTQERFFAFDALGRLVRAKNPEQGGFAADGDFPALIDPVSDNGQWSVGYVYDANGNLTKRKDARGVTAAYGYDALNRNTTVDYSDSTPDVTRTYDGAALGKGRPWRSEAFRTAHTAVDVYDATGRPKQRTQKFWVGVDWGQPQVPAYTTRLSYNLAGGVTSQTYPSEQKVYYQYDAMGRLGDNGAQPAFKGTLGDGVEKTYASEVLYDELGGRSQERYGTDTPVYNKHLFNSRGQLAEIRLSTHGLSAPGQGTGWDRGAIINHYSDAPGAWGASGGGSDNNGNLLRQEIFIPKFEGAGYDQAGGYDLFTQGFEYDWLNRLRRVSEGSQWRQEYDYDRWGNRTINAAGTWLGPLPPAPAPTPAPSERINETQFDKADLQNTNRLFAPGDTALPMEQRRMRYDGAGNLVWDGYTGEGERKYDAENRMTSAQFVSGQLQAAGYVYDADGRRVKRMTGTGEEVWQVYGVGGELLAEYAPGAAANSPQKEYGYRAGELLVTAAPGSPSGGSSDGGAPSAGLVGYWKFDEGSGSTAADGSGGGHPGSLQAGAGWAAGASGSSASSASLDGADDYVQMGSGGLTVSTGLTVSAWVYPTGGGTGVVGGTIVNREGEYELARFQDGTIRWAIANSSNTWGWVDTGYVAPLNSWTHVALTCDGSSVKTYANGQLVHTSAWSGLIGDAIASQNDFRVGGRQATPQFFQGRIDEVRVYDRALAAGEVPTLAGSTPLGLVGHWKFDEGAGGSAADSAGTGGAGTLLNGAAWGSGTFGGAVSFDGADDYVQVGSNSALAVSSGLTAAAWVYPTGGGATADGGVIVNREGEYEVARFADGTIRWAIANQSPGWGWVNTGYVAPLNRWTHVTFTYDGARAKTYADGQLVHDAAASGAIGDAIPAQDDFRIGGRQVTPQHFQGRIDEVRVYGRALTASEVSGLWSAGPPPGGVAVWSVRWLVSDQLGTPRMVVDRTGSLSGVSRHDYLPFGEALMAGTGGRVTAQGYGAADHVRQQFTGYERDEETKLDYAQARYFASTQGRFTSPDPLLESGDPEISQSWNRYTYALNNPLKFVDPTGLIWGYRDYQDADGGWLREFRYTPGEGVAEGYTPYTAPSYLFGDGRAAWLAEDGDWGWIDPVRPDDNHSCLNCREFFTAMQSDETWNRAAVGAIWNITAGRLLRALFGGRSASTTTPGLPKTAPKPLGRGSTGRAIPNNLREQLALEQAMSNPAAGSIIPLRGGMNDPRWPAGDGWVKMRQRINNDVEIHYVRNIRTGEVDDFKIKD